MPFVVPPGGAIDWIFFVDGFDVGVSVKIRTMGDGGSTEADLIPFKSYTGDSWGAGSWDGRQGVDAAVVTFRFDNTHSRLRSKKVFVKVDVVKPCPQQVSGQH